MSRSTNPSKEQYNNPHQRIAALRVWIEACINHERPFDDALFAAVKTNIQSTTLNHTHKTSLYLLLIGTQFHLGQLNLFQHRQTFHELSDLFRIHHAQAANTVETFLTTNNQEKHLTPTN